MWSAVFVYNWYSDQPLKKQMTLAMVICMAVRLVFYNPVFRKSKKMGRYFLFWLYSSIEIQFFYDETEVFVYCCTKYLLLNTYSCMRGIDINVSIVYQNLPSKYILLISRSANYGPFTIIKRIIVCYNTFIHKTWNHSTQPGL